MTDSPYIILTMKWGSAYTFEDVNKMYGMVQRHLSKPFRFFCFTDDTVGIREEVEVHPLPEIQIPSAYNNSPWQKLSMFQPELVKDLHGTALFLDLDLVIVDSIDCFFEIGTPEDFYIIENWTQMGQGIGNSSVYRFPFGGAANFIYERFLADSLKVCNTHANEQVFLSREIVAQGRTLKFWPDEWCRSFKRHCFKNLFKHWFFPPALPKKSKIVVFHGYPKPQDAIEGVWRGRPWKQFRPALWVKKHWRE